MGGDVVELCTGCSFLVAGVVGEELILEEGF